MSTATAEPIWVATNAGLLDCCRVLRDCDAIAVDTEFMRSDTFYPKAALLQLASSDAIYLVDPLAISDFAPLIELMQAQTVTKVLHSCSEDLEVFTTFLGTVPEPFIDTQVAAAYRNHGSAISYAALVKLYLDIDLPKDQTRSDWLQRPLTDRQHYYAAQDVAHLLPIYRELRRELEALGRWTWLEEDCRELLAAAKIPVDPALYYLRIKNAWKLNAIQLAVLQALTLWREHEARRENVPRNRIIADRALWEIAFRSPVSWTQLQAIDDIPPRRLRLHGDLLLSMVAKERDKAREELPEPLPRPLPLSERDLMSDLRDLASARAHALHLPGDVLVKKADLEFIVRSGMAGDCQLPVRLQGWRRTIIGDDLLRVARDRQIAVAGDSDQAE